MGTHPIANTSGATVTIKQVSSYVRLASKAVEIGSDFSSCCSFHIMFAGTLRFLQENINHGRQASSEDSLSSTITDLLLLQTATEVHMGVGVI